MQIERFEMERTQCLYENVVELNLSESGVLPLRVEELVESPAERQQLLEQRLWYCESDGSRALRERIAQFYPDCAAANITITNGGSEANYVSLWALLGDQGRLACMLPNYLQGWGLGRAYAAGADAFHLVVREERGVRRWALDLDSLERAVTPQTKVVLVTNPNNPTGAVLNAAEMEAVVTAARRVGAWLIVDEIYRGAEVDTDATTPTFWGRYDRVIITSGLSKAFGMPGLRIGWVVAPPEFIEQTWIRHDYLTLTPGLLNDRIAAIAMEPARPRAHPRTHAAPDPPEPPRGRAVDRRAPRPVRLRAPRRRRHRLSPVYVRHGLRRAVRRAAPRVFGAGDAGRPLRRHQRPALWIRLRRTEDDGRAGAGG